MPGKAARSLLSAVIVMGVMLSAHTAAAQNVSVTAANPNTGAQGTTSLVVKISGKNFAPGAKTDFFLSGTTNPAGITVHGTQWISASEVDATIDIADTASLALFDIKVTNTATGRSGKGSDMFSVIQKTQQQQVSYTYADAVTFRDAVAAPGTAGDGIVSDGNSTYSNGLQGVSVQIFTGSTGDLILNVGTSGRAIRALTEPDRFLTAIANPYPLSTTSWATLNVLDIWSVPVPAPGDTPVPVLRTAGIGGFVSSNLLEFGDHHGDGAGAYSTQVWVTRWSKTAWTISTDNTQAQSVYSTQTSQHPVRTGFTAEYALPFQVEVTCSRCATVP
jgi:hypothetical protein